MVPIYPSYVGKINRAESHLKELKAAIVEYGGANESERPYAVTKRMEGKPKRQRFRLEFTRSVDTTAIPYILADALYNLHSGLHHLAVACATKKPDSVSFPIFWRGVWDPVVDGENEQRTKDRERWASIADKLPQGAVTFLKRLQPPDVPFDSTTGEPNALRVLNRLVNNDRHTKLPVFASGLSEARIWNTMEDGRVLPGIGIIEPDSYVEDGAEIHAPDGTVDMKIDGTPQVVIRSEFNYPDGRTRNMPIVELVEDTMTFIRDTVVPPLARYATRG
jgi:hypothetical protein